MMKIKIMFVSSTYQSYQSRSGLSMVRKYLLWTVANSTLAIAQLADMIAAAGIVRTKPALRLHRQYEYRCQNQSQ
jgi:hypothetical protein